MPSAGRKSTGENSSLDQPGNFIRYDRILARIFDHCQRGMRLCRVKDRTYFSNLAKGMINFSGKLILVTGASRGIGAASALRFAAAGAAGVVIHYHRQREAAVRIAAEVERLGAKSLVIGADLANGAEVTALFDQVCESFDRLDVVVANAGIWPPHDRPLVDLDEDQWNRTMRVNLDGMYFVCRESVRRMIPQGSGSIVTVSSTAGQRGEAGHADYAATKGGVISLTKSLASELGPLGIRVNCVAPGWVDTDMTAMALHGDIAGNPEKYQRILDAIPLRRIATSDDIAGPILFLASELARHLTGEILNVNGGLVLCG